LEADPRFAGFAAERGDALLRYGYVLAGNPHDAADLAQEALLG
jgi:DNA-directed RNA polymerase specialized sigma24 family protein